MSVEYTNSVWYCLPAGIRHLKATRDQAITHDTRAGVNYMIILAACCYFEAAMESALTDIIYKLPKAAHPTDKDLRRDAKQRVHQAYGLPEYKDLFKLLLDVSISDLKYLMPEAESLEVMFKLRNSLAHGKALRSSSGPPTAPTARQTYEGSHKVIYGFLLKKRLISEPEEDMSLGWYHLDDDRVADFFWDFSFRSIVLIAESLPEDAAQVFRDALYIPEHITYANRLTAETH